jgi:hypothetical protein
MKTATIKYSKGKILADFAIYSNHDGKYFNLAIPAFDIFYFTEDENEIKNMGATLVERYFRLKLIDNNKSVAAIFKDLLKMGFSANTTKDQVIKRVGSKHDVTVNSDVAGWASENGWKFLTNANSSYLKAA